MFYNYFIFGNIINLVIYNKILISISNIGSEPKYVNSNDQKCYADIISSIVQNKSNALFSVAAEILFTLLLKIRIVIKN